MAKLENQSLISRNFGVLPQNPKHFTQTKKTSNEIVLLLWTLGAGKTTLLQNIAEYLSKQGEAFEVIVNDIGSFNIDAERLAKYNPTALTQGCICCSDLGSLKEVLESFKDSKKKILIEPSGIATGQEIKRIATELGMGSHVITLVNAEALPLMNEAQKQTAKTQIQLADTIGLTHLSENHAINEEAKQQIKTSNTQAPIFELKSEEQKEDLKKEEKSDLTPDLLKKQTHTTRFSYGARPTEKHEHHAHFHTQSIKVSEQFGIDELQNLIKREGNEVIRAKGTIAIEGQNFSFDYVQNADHQIKIWAPSQLSPHLNIITTQPLSQQELEMIQTTTQSSEKTVHSNHPQELIFSPIQVAEKVNHLLKQYADYMQMYGEKSSLEAEYQNNQNTETAVKIESLAMQLDQLGDDMKFDNPLVWIGYKRLAYAKDPIKKVDTIGSLLKHCERKTDICHKRLDFLNKKLEETANINLFDTEKIDQNQTLVDFLKTNDAIQKLCANKAFMQEWLDHEYFQVQGKAAKWQDYTSEE